MAVSVSSLKLTTKASGAQLVLSVPNILGTCSKTATSMAHAEGAEEQESFVRCNKHEEQITRRDSCIGGGDLQMHECVID